MKALFLSVSLGMGLLLFAFTCDGNMPKNSALAQDCGGEKGSCPEKGKKELADNCCGGHSAPKKDNTASKKTKEYVCPMKKHQYITMSKSGKCPLCKMKLVVKKPAEKQYTCPMKSHPKVYNKPGDCPLCGMKMVEKKGKPAKEYVCPMKSHQYMVMSKSGKCPLCKMKLVEKKKVAKEYVCPMKSHPKAYKKPGECPLCGMKLVEKK